MAAVDLAPLEAWAASLPSHAADPVAFAEAVGVTCDPWQQDVLRADSRRMLLNCARQSGKSTVTSLLALHRATTKPGALVLLVSPSLRQSAELFRKVASYRRAMPRPPALVEDNKLSMELANGSRIVSLPGSEATIRGFSAPSLVIEDESGDVPDDLYTAVRPMLAVSRGQMILVGTPKGKRGHFYENWQRPDEWRRISVSVHQNPRLSPQEIDEMRRDLGPLFPQECECQFIDAASGRVYEGFDDERNIIEEAPPLDHYILALDFGIVDDNAVSVLGWRNHDPCVYVVESYRIHADAYAMAEEANRVERQYKPERTVGDVGGMGKAFDAEIKRRFHVPLQPAEKHNKLGYISLLNADLRKGRIKVVRGRCEQLLEEWRVLPWAENRKKELEGVNNHASDATLYGWRAANAYREQPAPVKPKPGSKEAIDAMERDLYERTVRAAKKQERDMRGDMLVEDPLEAEMRALIGEDRPWIG